MNGPWRLDGLRSVETDPPAVMGVLNCTPDSFSDGGDHFALQAAVEAGLSAVKAGATILDIGGESTRPGAQRVDPAEQIRRVCPVVTALREHTDVALSVDTTWVEVAAAALDAGVNAINDVSAGTEDPGIFDLAAERGCGLVLMHRGAPPPEDQWSDAWSTPPAFEDVVVDVRAALEGRAEAAEAAGVSPDAIVLDPGLGFGKDVDQNWILLQHGK